MVHRGVKIMKIAVLTLMDDSNLGNRLQNYAVQEIFRKRGHDVTTVYAAFKNYNTFSANGIKGAVHDFLLKSGIRSSGFYSKYLKKDKNLFRGLEFTKDYIKTSKKYLYKFKHHKMSKHANDFDFWCVGSDQVWGSGVIKNNPEWFLNFADSNKTFSVSASFGNTNISNDILKEYEDGFNHIGNISVREKDGKELVKKVSGRDATLLLDPTLILDSSDWLKISKKPDGISDEPFILTYFLGGMSDLQRDYINRYAKKNNIRVLDVDNCGASVGPREFVYLVSKSEFVFTDSFHGCAFSTIFRKNFLSFNRRNYAFDMSGRIVTLLDTFSIETNFIREIDDDYESFSKRVDDIKQINMSCVDNAMKTEQERFNNFIKIAIND